jgi:hypothetical protein
MLMVGLTFTVKRWPGGLHMTFSQHAAANRWSIIFYSSLFLVTLPLLLWFFASWFVPEKGLPAAFLWFAGIAVLFQIVCTWVPEAGGLRTIAHRTLTGISGVAMLPLVVMIAVSPNLSGLVRATAWAVLLIMVVLLGIALKHQKGYRWALLLQAGYYGAFFVAILVTTYL